ncbi:MAG: YciI family protein [Chitinophagaceae bacterium]
MEEYMLIFRHEDGKKVASPEQMQVWMKQTMDWIGGIAAQNKFVGGNGLNFENSKIVWHKAVVTDGPFGEIKETIGGYLIVRADSVEEAVEFAKGSPVLQGEGNSMEVRKLAKRDGVH